MPNYFYNILFSGDSKFNSIIEIISQAGYTLLNPEEQVITGIIDSEEFESDNKDKVQQALSEKGGLLRLWGKSINLSLWFEVNSPLREISVIAEQAYFTENNPNREFVSEHLKKIFSELCKKTTSVYGYADDEHSCKVFGYDSNIENINTGKEPVLSWFNYFSTDYLEKIGGKKIFQNFNCNITEINSGGILVSFFNHPWEADFVEIQLLNEKWKEEHIFRDILK